MKEYRINNYDIFTGEDLIIADLIQRRRYQLLVHSCIYYHLHTSIISDYTWDSWARELVELQKDHPDISRQVVLYEYFEDFDGSTGFDLPIEEDWVVGIANKLLGKVNAPISFTKVPVVKKKQKSSKRRLF